MTQLTPVAKLQIFTHQGHDQIWTFAYGANMGSVRRVGISFCDNGGTGWWFFGGFLVDCAGVEVGGCCYHPYFFLTYMDHGFASSSEWTSCIEVRNLLLP